MKHRVKETKRGNKYVALASHNIEDDKKSQEAKEAIRELGCLIESLSDTLREIETMADGPSDDLEGVLNSISNLAWNTLKNISYEKEISKLTSDIEDYQETALSQEKLIERQKNIIYVLGDNSIRSLRLA
jgi:hypothetical protein